MQNGNHEHRILDPNTAPLHSAQRVMHDRHNHYRTLRANTTIVNLCFSDKRP